MTINTDVAVRLSREERQAILSAIRLDIAMSSLGTGMNVPFLKSIEAKLKDADFEGGKD